MMTKEIYVFKVALKHRKGLWRRIEIRGDQTLGDFDQIIRETFNHDPGDHLSEFYSGRVWRSKGFGQIAPDGSGSGVKKCINQLGLSEGCNIEYVYDFGDDIQHIITLEKITEPGNEFEYPRVVARNKPRYRYCRHCTKQKKKTIATWICIDCSQEEGKQVLICENCLMKKHEEHYAGEFTY